VAGDTAPAGAAQPGVGDGAQAQQEGLQGNMPWDLNDVPEELRPYMAEQLKRVEGGITQRFQEAAEFRRQMEPLSPFAEIEGLGEVPPEDLAGLVEFHQMAQDPEAFESWWEQVGNELGFFDGDEDGAEGGAEGEGEQPPAWAQELVNRLEQLEGGLQERTQTDAERDALAQIESEMAEVKKANSDLPWDNEEAAVEDRILQLAMSYGDDPQAIEKGLADYRAITGAGQAALVSAAEHGPAPALTGGNGDTAPQEVKGFDGAKAAAKARFAGAR
jgi:hypothetical protein